MRAPGWVARGAFVLAAALWHALLLAVVSGHVYDDLRLLPFTAPNVVVLAWVAARRGGPLPGVVPAFGAFALTLLIAPAIDFTVNPDPAVRVFVAVIGAPFGAAVLTLLALTLDRWRRAPCPATALEAWTVMALGAALIAFAPEGTPTFTGWPPEVGPRALRLYGLWIALSLSLGVFVAEVVAFARVARARSGRVSGLAVSDDAPKPWGLVAALPSWRLTDDDRLVPLVHTDASGSYRDDARGNVVARIPAATTWSWRLWVPPLVAALCALWLAH